MSCTVRLHIRKSLEGLAPDAATFVVLHQYRATTANLLSAGGVMIVVAVFEVASIGRDRILELTFECRID